MSTPFNQDFEDGDLIEADFVKQFIAPIQALESGASNFRDDAGAENAYQVDFSGEDPNTNAITSLQNGQQIVFRAANTNTDAATLQVVGPEETLDAVIITKSGESLVAGDIQANSMVAVIYNDHAGGRFEMVGSGGGGSGGGGGGTLFFGDGFDGDVTLTSDEELHEIKFYNNLTIESGVTLCTNGFKLHVSGTLTNDGVIHVDGGAAEDSTGSTVGAAGIGRGNTDDGVTWESPGGASGSLQTGDSVENRDNSCYLARGGNGGDGSYGSGGSGSHDNFFVGDRHYLTASAILSGLGDCTTWGNYTRVLRAGMAGGGGSGNDNDAAGGSGGGAGGVLWIGANYLAGEGELRAKGGDGGDAGGSDAGGGGGGGGGVIYLLSSDLSHAYTTNTDGGQGGTGGGGSGTDGEDGLDGRVVFRGGL